MRSPTQASFSDEEHRKAWLIRVAANTCKDLLKAAHRSDARLDEDDLEGSYISNDQGAQPSSFSSDVVDAMRALPDPPRTPPAAFSPFMKAIPLRKSRR